MINNFDKFLNEEYKKPDEPEIYIPIKDYPYASVEQLQGKKVSNDRLGGEGYINDDNIANWGKIGSQVFVVSSKGSDQGHYWDVEDVFVIESKSMKNFDDFEKNVRINESEVILEFDDKFQKEVQSSKGFGDAPTISKEEAEKLLNDFSNATDDQVIDLCRYFALNRVPYPLQIKKSIDARMKEKNLNPYKSLEESVSESTPSEAMKMVKHFDKPTFPKEPFKREFTDEERKAMDILYPMYSYSNIDADGNIVLGGGEEARGKFYITEEDLKKLIEMAHNFKTNYKITKIENPK